MYNLGMIGFFKELISNFTWDIGVDLGSSNTLIYLKDRGIVVDEPTVIARQKRKNWTGLSAPKVNYRRPIAYGLKAKEMLNKEPKQIEVISPLKNGIVSDLEAMENLISYFMKLVYEVPSKYPKILKPRVIVGVSGNINQVQKRAIKSVFLASGAREVILVEQAILAAIGIGLPINQSSGLVVVDIGGGKTEINVISMGGVVVGKQIKTAGNDLDFNIINYIKMKYGLLIGQNSAEKIKKEIGGLTSIVRGRDLETGLPKSVKLLEGEIREAVDLEISKIVKAVKEVLDETPPELMEDILKRGIVMVGNGSKLKGIDKMIERETKIRVEVAENPGLCVIKGCGQIIENKDLMKQIKLVSGF
jgi:rod shape-determining protein MreB and related proteins